jgi:predicted transcriptional regulator
MTKTQKVLTAFQEGQELTAKQIAARYSVGNPGRVVHYLRNQGYSIYLNKKVDTKGRVTNKYRLGNPSRKVIAAGYKALSLGLV